MDDKEIINGIVHKESVYLNELIMKYGSMIYNVTSSYLYGGHEKGDIEECINDTFLCIWNNIDCFSIEKGNFKSWLIGVAKHKALDYKRKLSKALNNVDIDDVPISSKEDLENDLIQKETNKETIAILNSLDETDKNIFELKYFKDESVEEISRKTGLTKMSVYNRLSRGRRKLKNILMNKIQESI